MAQSRVALLLVHIEASTAARGEQTLGTRSGCSGTYTGIGTAHCCSSVAAIGIGIGGSGDECCRNIRETDAKVVEEV